MDATENVYFNDANYQRPLKTSPNCQVTTLLQGEYLMGGDARQLGK
jgi:hypothetical protein